MRPIRKTIAECLKYRVKESAGEPALETESQCYTWNDLDELSNYMAGRMLFCGIRKGTHVGIWSTNSPNWLIVFLALSKIGAVPVLLDTCYPLEIMIRVLRYADVEFVYYGEGYRKFVYEDMVADLQEALEGQVKRWIYIGRDNARQWMTRDSFVFAERMKKTTRGVNSYVRAVEPEETAVMVFAPGTAANPRGILLSHFSLVNNAQEMCRNMGWSKEDKMLLAAPLFYSFGITSGFLTSLQTGFCIHLIEYYKTAQAFLRIQRFGCTVLNGVPSMFLAMSCNKRRKEYDLSSLRSGIIAGAPVSKEEYALISRELPGLKLHPSYGKTETSPCISIGDAWDDASGGTGFMGKVIRHCQVDILGADGLLLPPGEDGEICVSGYNVMQGYYRHSEAELSGLDSSGRFHTGDIGHLDSRGQLYVTGRVKETIVRGELNIAPADIEAAILTYPGIKAVKVIGLPARVLKEKIVACVVLEEGAAVSDAGLLIHLEKYLVSYMLPSRILRLDSLPLDENGAVDTQKLKRRIQKA